MTTFTQLIHVAPFNDETRQKILSQESALSEDDRLRLTDVAWSLLQADLTRKRNKKMEELLLESEQKKQPFDTAQFEQYEQTLIHELATKLEGADTEAKIEEVKQSLQQQVVPKEVPNNATSS